MPNGEAYQEWVSDMTPEDIVAAADGLRSDRVQITLAVERLLALAGRYYASGRAGLAYLPFRAHFSIGVAAKVYRQIGIQLLNSKRSWHGGRQVTSKAARCSTLSVPPPDCLEIPHIRRHITHASTHGSSRTSIKAVAGDEQRWVMAVLR